MTLAAQTTLFTTMERSASLSADRVYRYELWRQWGAGPYVNFICLNPSTADENADDPTVKKCMKFTRSWGYNALCITNLFAYRATDRRKMMKFADPIGFGNDRRLLNVAENAGLVVCSWSQDGNFNGRASAVKKLLYKLDLHYLRISQGGQPWHPLYLPDKTVPSRWYVR